MRISILKTCAISPSFCLFRKILTILAEKGEYGRYQRKTSGALTYRTLFDFRSMSKNFRALLIVVRKMAELERWLRRVSTGVIKEKRAVL